MVQVLRKLRGSVSLLVITACVSLGIQLLASEHDPRHRGHDPAAPCAVCVFHATNCQEVGPVVQWQPTRLAVISMLEETRFEQPPQAFLGTSRARGPPMT